MNKIGTILIGLLIIGIGLLGIWYVLMAPKQSSTDQIVETTPPKTVVPSPTEEMPLPTLIGTNWVATTIAEEPIIAGITISTNFSQDGRITGNDGCNNFSGTYTTTGNLLTIDPNLISTKMACEPAIDQQASTFITSLLATTRYELAGRTMILYQSEGVGITMIDQGNSLAKTSWNVISYNNGNQAVVGVMADTAITMTFGEDGTVAGNSGCNSFSGQYSTQNSSIQISQLASTMMACETPEGVMDQETAFVAALQSASQWQMQGNELSFRTLDDALAITATRNDL